MTFNIEQLAKILDISEATLRKKLCVEPESLPPRLKLPKGRKVLWLKDDVEEWLRSHRDQK
jgi:predicted DNA-binding transcriptional regulator AlpA